MLSQEWWRRELYKPMTAEQMVNQITAGLSARDANDYLAQARTWQRHNVGDTPGFGGDVEAEAVFDVPQRESASFEPADQWERERAVGFDRELAGQIGLVVRRDRQHVLRADDVVGDRRSGLRSGCNRRKREEQGE